MSQEACDLSERRRAGASQHQGGCRPVTDASGGAAPAKARHGLAGLAERLDGVDGRLTVTSPAGGPTRVEAVIPCAPPPFPACSRRAPSTGGPCRPG